MDKKEKDISKELGKKIKWIIFSYAVVNCISLGIILSYKKNMEYTLYEYSDYFWSGFFNVHSGFLIALSILIAVVFIAFSASCFKESDSNIISNKKIRILNLYILWNSMTSLLAISIYYSFLQDVKTLVQYYPQKLPEGQLGLVALTYLIQFVLSIYFVNLLKKGEEQIEQDNSKKNKLDSKLKIFAITIVIVGLFRIVFYTMYVEHLGILAKIVSYYYNVTEYDFTVLTGIEPYLDVLTIGMFVMIINSLLLVIFGIKLAKRKRKQKQKPLLNLQKDKDNQLVKLDDDSMKVDLCEQMCQEKKATEEQYQKTLVNRTKNNYPDRSTVFSDYVYLKNESNGLVEGVKIGFSWTTLFFGFFPALFRGDGKWVLIQIIASLFTWGFSMLIFPFTYNKIYINKLITRGYVPARDIDKEILIKNGMLINYTVAKEVHNPETKNNVGKVISEVEHKEKIQLLKEYKELFDQGIISEAEFQEKKTQIL